jgi:hypothetical protein
VTFEEAIDSWITNPGTHVAYITVYCTNLACPALNEPVEVVATQEYGATTWNPDGCPDCGLPLEEEPLEVNDEG